MNNIFYFGLDNKISKFNSVVNNIHFEYKNSYSLDFPNSKVLDYIINLISNDEPIILIGTSKTTYGACLYSYELYKRIKNKIILVLFSPFITLHKKNYSEFNINDRFKLNHSIHRAFKDYKDEYDNIVLNDCMRNEMIQKYIFIADKDIVIPHKFINNLMPSFKNTITTIIKGTILHNILSLFWFGFSKNFDKFKVVNYYVPTEELLICSKIWKTSNYYNLIENILSNDLNKFKLELEYSFIDINKY